MPFSTNAGPEKEYATGSLTSSRGFRVARSRILLFLVVWSIVGSELKPAIEDPPSGRAPARYHLTAAIVARL